jgi:hypothetical protein
MGSQHTRSRNVKSIAGAALVGLGLFVLLGNVDVCAAQLSCPLGTAAEEVLAVLPCVALEAASQALRACILNHQRLLEAFVQMLVSFWSLLLVILGLVSVRGRFQG